MVLQIKIKLEKGMRVQAILNKVVMDGLSDKVTFETDYDFNCVKIQLANYIFSLDNPLRNATIFHFQVAILFSHSKDGGKGFSLALGPSKDGYSTSCVCPQQRWRRYFLFTAFALNKDGAYGTGSLTVWIQVAIFIYFF